MIGNKVIKNIRIYNISICNICDLLDIFSLINCFFGLFCDIVILLMRIFVFFFGFDFLCVVDKWGIVIVWMFVVCDFGFWFFEWKICEDICNLDVVCGRCGIVLDWLLILFVVCFE